MRTSRCLERLVSVLNKQVARRKAGVGGKREQRPKDSISIKVPEGACDDKHPKQRSTSTKLTQRQWRATPEHKCDRRWKPDPKPKQLEPPAPARAAQPQMPLNTCCTRRCPQHRKARRNLQPKLLPSRRTWRCTSSKCTQPQLQLNKVAHSVVQCTARHLATVRGSFIGVE